MNIITFLSQTNLELLREYWRHFVPKKWLFEGETSDKHILILVDREFHLTIAKKTNI